MDVLGRKLLYVFTQLGGNSLNDFCFQVLRCIFTKHSEELRTVKKNFAKDTR